MIGGVVLAGAGVAAAASGGGSTPTPLPATGTKTSTFVREFTPDATECCFGPITVTRAGPLAMVATWPDPTAIIEVGYEGTDGNTQALVRSPRSIPPATRLEFTTQVGPGNLRLRVYRWPGGSECYH